MPIVLARIDDRLIHGQITVSWSKVSSPDIIAIVSDEVASDDIQRSALGFGAPLGIELQIYTVRQAGKELNPKSPKIKKRVFVIAPTPKDFLDLIQAGVRIDSINVGQMGFKQGRMQISKTVSVGKDDVQAFKELHALSIGLEQRQLPSDRKVELEKLLPGLL
jgi:mannose/fructose/sorbose-specific phosphotransferase system IIB component